MDTKYQDVKSRPSYEALLTLMCQCGLAGAGGGACTQRPERGAQVDRVLHVADPGARLREQLGGKDVIVWDTGLGLRMAPLLRPGQAKGHVEVVGAQRLYQFAAGAAAWIVNTLRSLGRDYVAFIAADQVLHLSKDDRAELAALLEAASDADAIFLDGPPSLSLPRLRFLLDSDGPAKRGGAMALARDRQMLKHHGGAHVLQCVLFKSPYATALAGVLEAIGEAAQAGCHLDLGIGNVAVLPRLIGMSWLKRGREPALRAVQAALGELCGRLVAESAVTPNPWGVAVFSGALGPGLLVLCPQVLTLGGDKANVEQYTYFDPAASGGLGGGLSAVPSGGREGGERGPGRGRHPGQ